jgi:hypothetical protein
MPNVIGRRSRRGVDCIAFSGKDRKTEVRQLTWAIDVSRGTV